MAKVKSVSTPKISLSAFGQVVFVFRETIKIIEQGSHEELMSKNGHYAKLYNLQAKWYK